MKANYKYATSSRCISSGNSTVLGLSADISRDEKVSFNGKLKNPLLCRDAMLMLRDIVISDMTIKKKERTDFFTWLDSEIDRRMLKSEQYLKATREDISGKLEELTKKAQQNQLEIDKLTDIKDSIKKEIDKKDAWKDYYNLERNFWKYIRDRDYDLWFVLDPVITVHPDEVTFEAFSVDESTYGCLSINMDEFDLLSEPALGTTNIDFSEKLSREIERFRTYSDVTLSINPEGFNVKNNVVDDYVEKKIDLPESWVKGFCQVSSASIMDGIEVTLSSADMYDICSFLRTHKEKNGPRYMKWILEPGKNIRVVFMPFDKEIVLDSIYTGKRKREEKIWGRRRWLVLEKVIPLSKAFKVKLLGFGMPQIIVADMGNMKMTIGFSAWSSNDWVKGTAFNILAGFIGDGNYSETYDLLKDKRMLSFDELSSEDKSESKAGVGMLFKKGEGFYDLTSNMVRFRRLFNEEIPKEMYEVSDLESAVLSHFEEGLDSFSIFVNEDKEYTFKHSLKKKNSKYHNYSYYGTEDFDKEYDLSDTKITIDQDGQIVSLSCNCKKFKKGKKNISDPCDHILALYILSIKFLKVDLDPNKEYKINDIMEKIL